jgi:membrane protein insertase Oxa1/YidC/SpoIIIJ
VSCLADPADIECGISGIYIVAQLLISLLQGGGFSWLLPLQDGAPPVGWADAIAYLSLPVLLVVSQFVSQKIISPPQSNDPSQQSSQWIGETL